MPLIALVVFALAACGSGTAQPSTDEASGHRAVVVVSGAAAESPYTTPSQACAEGLPAGNTDSALRESLLKAGHEVYTSPAKVGTGQITSSTGFGGFAACPDALPERMTVDAVGSLDDGGEHLAAFITYLHDAYGIDPVDLVAHSLGGMFSRAAI